jgi:hypothetical protein
MSLPQPSPFVFDGPVEPSMLIGRDEEVRTLRAWARAGRSTVLVAPRRFGKTSLLRRVQADSERLDRMPVIVVDLYELASMSDLVIRLEHAWATNIPGRLRARLGKALAGTEFGINVLGNGFRMRLADRPNTDPLPALHTLLDLPTRMSGRGGRVVIVFDEFQAAANVPGIEGILRTYVQDQRDTASYIFCGSQPSMIARMFGDQGRPFYSQAQRFELGRLDVGLLVDSVADIFDEAGRPGYDGAITALMTVGEGHPQRSMLLAHLLWQRVDPGAAAPDDTTDLVEAVVADALRAVTAEVTALFDVLPTNEKKALRAIAEYGSPLSSRALRDLDLRKPSAQSAAAALLERALIERPHAEGADDVRWRIVDPLTTRWLRTRYPTRPGP